MTQELFNYIHVMLDDAQRKLQAVQTVDANVVVEQQLWDEADQWDWELDVEMFIDGIKETE